MGSSFCISKVPGCDVGGESIYILMDFMYVCMYVYMYVRVYMFVQDRTSQFSEQHSFVSGMTRFRISAWTPAVLSEILTSLPNPFRYGTSW
jgi:hypothetical protein